MGGAPSCWQSSSAKLGLVLSCGTAVDRTSYVMEAKCGMPTYSVSSTQLLLLKPAACVIDFRDIPVSGTVAYTLCRSRFSEMPACLHSYSGIAVCRKYGLFGFTV